MSFPSVCFEKASGRAQCAVKQSCFNSRRLLLEGCTCVYYTHRPVSSSFVGLAYRILNINHKKKELLRGLWVSQQNKAAPKSAWKLAAARTTYQPAPKSLNLGPVV